MKELKDLTVMCLDKGLFVEVAARMAKDVKRVLYHVPSSDPCPKMNPSSIGVGIDGVEVCLDFFGPHFKEVDLFFFPSVGLGDLQEHLVSIGKTVFGSRGASLLEVDRPACKELLEEAGLSVNPWTKIVGLGNLRAYLKENKNVFVKISRYRGTAESFYSKDYKHSEPILDQMEYKLGPLKHIMEFDVEDELPDCIETGSDSYCIDGKTPAFHLSGFEVKDSAFAGKIVEHSKLPQPMKDVDAGMSELMKRLGCRGFYSTEIRIGKDKEPYMIDACMRMGYPPGHLYSMMYENFSDIIWQGANGVVVDPVASKKFGVQLQMKSNWAGEENWQVIDIDPSVRDMVKVASACKIKDRFYSVPLTLGICEPGCVLGLGNSLDEAVKECEKNAEGVSGYGLKIDCSCLVDAKQAFLDAEKIGIRI